MTPRVLDLHVEQTAHVDERFCREQPPPRPAVKLVVYDECPGQSDPVGFVRPSLAKVLTHDGEFRLIQGGNQQALTRAERQVASAVGDHRRHYRRREHEPLARHGDQVADHVQGVRSVVEHPGAVRNVESTNGLG